MAGRSLLLLFLIALSFPGCIALRDDVKRDIETAKVEVETTSDAKMKAMKEDSAARMDSLEKRIASLETSLNKLGVKQSSQINLSFSNIDELKQTILELNRRIDQLDVALKAQKNDTTILSAVNEKIAGLEEANKALSEEIAELKEAAKPVEHVTITKQGTIRLPEKKGRAYKELVKLTRAIKPKDGSAEIIRSGWKKFRNRWSDYRACDVTYWIGETYYLDGKYNLAVTAFKEIDAKFKSCKKREASYLRVAWSLYRLKRYKTARAIVEAMKSEFPKSSFPRDVKKLQSLLKKHR